MRHTASSCWRRSSTNTPLAVDAVCQFKYTERLHYRPRAITGRLVAPNRTGRTLKKIHHIPTTLLAARVLVPVYLLALLTTGIYTAPPAPEILLRTGWSYPSDVWAAGCTIAELALGYQLFPAKNSAEHLAMIERRLGKFPRRLLIRGKGCSSPIASRCFHRMTAKHKMGEIMKEDSLDYVENECKKLKEEMGEEGVASGLYEMLSLVLTIDPWFRPKAKKALALAKNIGDVDDNDE